MSSGVIGNVYVPSTLLVERDLNYFGYRAYKKEPPFSYSLTVVLFYLFSLIQEFVDEVDQINVTTKSVKNNSLPSVVFSNIHNVCAS